MMMKTVARALYSLAVLLALTAFAPAPLPRAKRGGEADPTRITVSTFQGKWRVAGVARYNGDGTRSPHNWQVTHVQVKGDRWTFMRNEAPSNGYSIAIDNAKKPATLDFTPPPQGGGGTTGLGIICRRGDVVEIVYYFGTTTRAESFERPPAGHYLLTLHRQR